MVAEFAPLAQLSRRTTSLRHLTARVLLREPLLVFLIAFGAYLGIGLYTTLHLRLVVGDAESRLAHAYFALWGKPAKLAAIGLFWPPLQTLVLVPFAAVRPLATSLVALPASSALFAAGTLVVVERALALAGVRRLVRFPILAALGLNPIVLYYAVNGMAESLFLFFLTAAVAVFVSWAIEPRWYHPALIGVMLAFGVLSRFEVGFWLPVLLLGVLLVYARQHQRLAAFEASLLVMALPVAFALGLWMYLNWTIVGSPTAFIRANAVNLPHLAARPHVRVGLGTHGTPVAADFVPRPHSGTPIWPFVSSALRLQFDILPATWIVGAALVAFAVVRRNLVAASLAIVVLLQTGVAAVWALWTAATSTGSAAVLLLRYNIRAIPLTVVAAAWLLAALPARRRTQAGVVLLLVLAASAPVSARTMLHHRVALGEAAFLDGLRTGRPQDGAARGTRILVADQQRMAAYIRAHVRGEAVVLTDDAQTFGVILQDGHPERYFDRIGVGDSRWRQVVEAPALGRVRYLLVSPTITASAFDQDRIVARYPTLATPGDWPPFIGRLVYRTRAYALFSLYNGASP